MRLVELKKKHYFVMHICFPSSRCIFQCSAIFLTSQLKNVSAVLVGELKLIHMDSFGVSLLQLLLPQMYRTVPTETSQNASGTVTIERNPLERYDLFLRLSNLVGFKSHISLLITAIFFLKN